MISFTSFLVCALACFSPAILISIGERRKARERQREAAARLAAKRGTSARAAPTPVIRVEVVEPPHVETQAPQIHTLAQRREILARQICEYKKEIAAELRKPNPMPDRIRVLCARIRQRQEQTARIDAKRMA